MSIFTEVNMSNPKSNVFDLSHEKKLSGKVGKLIPILCEETLPGDKWNIRTEVLSRFAPLIAPVMHRVNIYVHAFFCPNRLVWSNWENFITGGEDGLDNSVHPTVLLNPSTLNEGTVADYVGIPVGGPNINIAVNAIPFAIGTKIFNDYYRDQNLMGEGFTDLVDGNNTDPALLAAINTVGERSWQHDYFTSALPWTQKGAEATIPLGTEAPIVFDATRNVVVAQSAVQLDGVTQPAAGNTQLQAGVSPLRVFQDSAGNPIKLNVGADHYADLSTATAAGITDLRNAFRLQEWLEKNARGGSRYIESILVHFGVRSSDARLQRPEYLGGATSQMVISEVLQTSANASEPTPQGNMAGHGIGYNNGSISYSCEEHGYVFMFLSVMPKSSYQDGLRRIWDKIDKFDYAWPEFAHIGEQAIENFEVYLDTDTNYNVGTFGYTPRYSEYKYIPSSVHGAFRSTLDFWHMGRKFSSQQNLNGTFVSCQATEIDRIFAVPSADDHLYFQVMHNIRCERKLPYFGNPTI